MPKSELLAMADSPIRATENPQPMDLLPVIERLATNPEANVEKLDRLLQLQERVLARGALERFVIAMADAQTEMRPVAADAENPQTRSKYASYAKLDRALRPIYTRHGFALSFNTGESSLAEHVRVLCYLSHRDGHEREYHVDMPNDGKGARGGDVMTRTHATGAAMSYGMRYLLKMIFNVAVGEDDVDGNEVKAKREQPDAPKAFDDWLTDLEAVADEGTAALMAAFNQSAPELRKHLTRTNVAKWEELKKRAARATRAGSPDYSARR